jgi:hypothetical protein
MRDCGVGIRNQDAFHSHRGLCPRARHVEEGSLLVFCFGLIGPVKALRCECAAFLWCAHHMHSCTGRPSCRHPCTVSLRCCWRRVCSKLNTIERGHREIQIRTEASELGQHPPVQRPPCSRKMASSCLMGFRLMVLLLPNAGALVDALSHFCRPDVAALEGRSTVKPPRRSGPSQPGFENQMNKAPHDPAQL